MNDDYSADAFLDSCDEIYFQSGSGGGDDAMAMGGEEGKPTVEVHDEWQLVFAGTGADALQYTCSGLLSVDILHQEPGLVVPVAFALQVHGMDFPSYERSRLSDEKIFYTKNQFELEGDKYYCLKKHSVSCSVLISYDTILSYSL